MKHVLTRSKEAYIVAGLLLATPLLALAQNQFLTIIQRIQAIFDALVPLAITAALLYFIWGVAKFITAKDDTAKQAARDAMIYGAVGLFAIVSIWGIVQIIQQFTGVSGSAGVVTPAIPR